MKNPLHEFSAHYSAAHRALEDVRLLLFDMRKNFDGASPWCAISEVAYVAGQLAGIRDRLAGTGEYEEGK